MVNRAADGATASAPMNHDPYLTTGYSDIYSVLDLPVFQNRMFASAEEARNCVRGDVKLVRDWQSGLIFNRAFHPDLMAYDANYQNEQAVSAVFREHLSAVAATVERNFRGFSLIEVGCGKGHFLEQLQARGFAVTGVDPIYEGSNSSVIRDYFSPSLGLRADGIILRHVLEHVQGPVEFLARIRDANGGRGKIYIEVPCFDWICKHRAWFDVFYEHVNYFRMSDFRRIFGTIYESAHVFEGQYLYVVADLATLRNPVHGSLDDFKFPTDFLNSVNEHAANLRSQRSSGSAIWGGASKGVIFALFMERAGASVDVVIDVNPGKHGKYLPGTGLQVHSPEQALRGLPRGANIYIMNGNYLEEIVASTFNRFNYLTVDHDSI
jgi:SAM-dependent methyltransferase